MLDNFIYENHTGRRFVGLENNVFLNYNDLRDYTWSYDTINSRISRFYRPITTRSIPLVVACQTDAEAVTVKNRIMEIAEADVDTKLAGKVYVGDYYTKGFITASKKSEYLASKRVCKIGLTLTSDDPSWYKETKYVFKTGGDNKIGFGGGTDYPYDYPYDYALSTAGRRIVCDSVGGNAFKIIIYGNNGLANPSITIGGHVYAVDNIHVGAGETLTIDSLEKTITWTRTSGANINVFDKRNRDYYIFEQIPSGVNTVSWSGTFDFDLTVIEKRSEPKWT